MWRRRTHEALRLSFHDVVGFSQSGALAGNGADGFIMIFDDTELMNPANEGVNDAIDNRSRYSSNSTSRQATSSNSPALLRYQTARVRYALNS